LRFKLSLGLEEQWRRWVEIPQLTEVLLETRRLSRFGQLELESAVGMIDPLREMGQRVVVAWDLLPRDAEIADALQVLQRLRAADAVLVRDAGAALAVRAQFPNWPLQLNLEAGNHNDLGVRAWARRLAPQLERLVISNEVPVPVVASWPRIEGVELETQVLGPVLMFHSPRFLLSPHLGLEPGAWVERVWEPEDKKRPFPVLENRHGTFLFYEKLLCLLQEHERLDQAGVSVGRLDLRGTNHAAMTRAVVDYLRDPGSAALDRLRAQLGVRTTRGFFKSNRTDRQFKRLKHHHKEPPGCVNVGEVLETRKKRYMVVRLEQPIAVEQELVVINPEGLTLEDRVHWLADLSGFEKTRIAHAGIWIMNHVRRASAGSRLFIPNPSELDPSSHVL